MHPRRRRIALAPICLLASLAGLASPPVLLTLPRGEAGSPGPGVSSPHPPRPPVDFRGQVRPLLSDRCFSCHGPDEETRRADLRLDTRDGAFEDLGGYAAVVPGHPETSAIIARITAEDPRDRMPPRSSVKGLSAAEVELLRRWIEEGAEWKDHWAYESLRRPEVPEVPQLSEAPQARGLPELEGSPEVSSIDRFILARLAAEGLALSAEADRVTLARRLSLDLTGLPPSPDEAQRFAADESPDAYETLVDRLLASPHYGERMAVWWLDLVRYADTTGYHGDNHRDVWAYRDWVIRALNENMPFDRFTTEQLAGDLLPGSTFEQKVASGYNRLNMTTQEGGAQPGEYVAKYAADRVRNVGSVWLGATVGCAECHDHKYDPYTTRDFYSMAAFFADIRERPIGEPAEGILRLPDPERSADVERLDAEISAAKARGEDVAALQKAKAELEARWPSTLVSVAGEPRIVRILPRGNWLDESGAVVEPAVPHFLPKIEKDGRADRLDLARWILSSENPLTARVVVNRLWRLFFGQGLSRNLDDLGSQGAHPSHPDLLDWLAAEFRDGGWDVKRMVRMIVLSRAYRQSSLWSRELRERDPYNALLARQSRWRLDAEWVRDVALDASGLLSPRIGGPSVKPPQPAGYWSHLNFPQRQWVADRGDDVWRRGLYTYWQRTFLYPSFLAFDAPTREDCVAERTRSNTPLQALVLLNDPVHVEAARAFAARILREGGSTDAERIAWAFRRATSRGAEGEEGDMLQESLTHLLAEHLEAYRADAAAADRLLQVGTAPLPDGVDRAALAAWTSVARAILNLQETYARN